MMGRFSITRRISVVATVLVGAVVACQPGPPELPPFGGSYAALGCAGCHGPRGQGGPAAPPVVDLARHWDEERLLAYLRDPEGVKRHDPRLVAQSGTYPLRMRPVKGATDDELRGLAQELLAN